MTALLARRLTIICLISMLFAAGLLAVVQNHSRGAHIGQVGLGAPCPQPQGVLCKARI